MSNEANIYLQRIMYTSILIIFCSVHLIRQQKHIKTIKNKTKNEANANKNKEQV